MLQSLQADNKSAFKKHSVVFDNRKGGMITGVKDVISFDLTSVLLETEYGMATIKGHDLHINRLSVENGELEIEGTIDGLMYSEVSTYAKKGESVFARLFK